VAYHVSLTVRAQRDLQAIYEYVHAGESVTARRWYDGLKRAILSLEQHPRRCPATSENRNVRHLLYGHKSYVYRVLFRVREKNKRVNVLHVHHGARRRSGRAR